MKKFLLLLALLISNTAFAADYTKYVMDKIVHNVTYPKMAKMRNQEGTVTLVISIDVQGKATAIVEKSSGSESLDNAAIDAVRNSSPFDPPTVETVVKGNVKFDLSN